MKYIFIAGRVLIGFAYVIYGYLHMAYSKGDMELVPNNIGSKSFWVIAIGVCWFAVALSFFTNVFTRVSGILASILLVLIMIFAILLNFDGVSSIMSMGSLLSMIGGSIMVSATSRVSRLID